MNKSIYKAIEDHMLSLMQDSAHDKEHIYRVLYIALDIASHEVDVNMDVLIAACLLHDIGRGEQYKNPKVCHAQAGSAMAYDFLMQMGWQDRIACSVADCIYTHRFRNDSPPESLEAKILFDADKVDATGLLGIARTLVYQGIVSQPLYTVDDADLVMDGSGESPPSFMHEYKFKLEKLYGVFYTRRAREIAAGRRASAAAFYQNLLAETADCYGYGQSLLDHAFED